MTAEGVVQPTHTYTYTRTETHTYYRRKKYYSNSVYIP